MLELDPTLTTTSYKRSGAKETNKTISPLQKNMLLKKQGKF
jgi:hypothetical protein